MPTPATDAPSGERGIFELPAPAIRSPLKLDGQLSSLRRTSKTP